MNCERLCVPPLPHRGCFLWSWVDAGTEARTSDFMGVLSVGSLLSPVLRASTLLSVGALRDAVAIPALQADAGVVSSWASAPHRLCERQSLACTGRPGLLAGVWSRASSLEPCLSLPSDFLSFLASASLCLTRSPCPSPQVCPGLFVFSGLGAGRTAGVGECLAGLGRAHGHHTCQLTFLFLSIASTGLCCIQHHQG